MWIIRVAICTSASKSARFLPWKIVAMPYVQRLFGRFRKRVVLRDCRSKVLLARKLCFSLLCLLSCVATCLSTWSLFQRFPFTATQVYFWCSQSYACYGRFFRFWKRLKREMPMRECYSWIFRCCIWAFVRRLFWCFFFSQKTCTCQPPIVICQFDTFRSQLKYQKMQILFGRLVAVFLRFLSDIANRLPT